jgi:hypothetical protein
MRMARSLSVASGVKATRAKYLGRKGFGRFGRFGLLFFNWYIVKRKDGRERPLNGTFGPPL